MALMEKVNHMREQMYKVRIDINSQTETTGKGRNKKSN
jgi:hypothetical protein